METQRQWSDLAIARTTPTLLALFSFVTILAEHLQANFTWKVRQTFWYSKLTPIIPLVSGMYLLTIHLILRICQLKKS
jgi:hypothetical protein